MIRRSLYIFSLGLAFGAQALAQESPAATSNSKAASAIDQALRAELLAILDGDQRDRLKIDAVTKEHGFNSSEVQALLKTMHEKDLVNRVKIRAILDTCGWVGPEEVGAEASSALFFVIQHADTATQQKYLPLMRTAVRQRKALPNQLALLEDRVALAEGRRQIYGSQLLSDPKDGHLYVRPLEDPDHVDERRASVGLGTMAEYLKLWNLTWDVETYKKELPALEVGVSIVIQ